MELFQGMFGKIAPGMCRLSMDGSIAIRTSGGYRTYSVKSGRLTNCDSFVFNIGEDFFFLIPTGNIRDQIAAGNGITIINKTKNVEINTKCALTERQKDIILAGGRPKCVIKADGNLITAINYEDGTVEQILPEHHMLLGNTCLYGRIVSVFGRNGTGGPKGMSRVMKYMMMSEMLKGNGADGMKASANPMGQAMLAMMMMGGKGDDMFDELFSFDEENEDTNAAAPKE